MPSKDKMIAEELRRLAALLESGDSELGDDDLPKLLFPLSLSLAPRIYEIEQKLDRLLERPSRVECRLSGADGDSVIQLMTGRGSTARAEAVRHLKKCFEGAQHLTICDPYFLTPRATPPDDYVKTIDTVLPGTLKRLDIFVGKGRNKRNGDVADGINSLCKNRDIRLSCVKTDDIHDRVWIADYDRAYVVGTSFNGLGNQCAFILLLPPEDKKLFIREIASRRDSLPKSKSV